MSYTELRAKIQSDVIYLVRKKWVLKLGKLGDDLYNLLNIFINE